ncbi:MAG: hypothetical protein ACKO3R_04240 [bacterium]
MVSSPITFNLSKVDYFKGKSEAEIKKAQEAAGKLDHAEMVKSFTDFIDNLINLEVGKLEADAKDTSNPKAQKAAKENLDKYNTNTTTIASFKGEVADDLAKNIYAVKQLLIEGGLANQRGDTLTFKAKNGYRGDKIVLESAKELEKQALASIKERLSACGINIDNAKATELQKEILEQLKKPPAPKNQTDATDAETKTQIQTTETTATKQADPATAGTQEAKPPTAEETEKSIKNIINASPALANLVKNIKGLDILLARIESIENVETQNPTPENIKKFNKDIFLHIADEAKFKEAISKLDSHEQAALKTILNLVHGQADKEITCNEMSAHARNINNRLGANSTPLEAINNSIDGLISKKESSDTAANQLPIKDNLKRVNKILETFEKGLEEAAKLPSAAARVAARKEAQAELIKDLDDESINLADLKMLKEVLEKPDSANSSYNKRADKFLKDLNISTDDLKQWGSMAAVLAVGLMIFCPGAINGLVRAGSGLVNMTLGHGVLPMMIMNHFSGGNHQGINPMAAMMMGSNNNKNHHH